MVGKEGKISVIIPIYKSEQFLSECVNSVINQTYTNLEIILVDDGSPDRCGKLCDEYAKRDSRIKVIHKVNGGVSSARNMGLDLATGSFVTFIDSDDTVEKNFFSQIMNILHQEAADVIACGFNFCRKNKKSERTHQQKSVLCDNEIIKNYLMDNIRPEACGKIIQRDLIRDIRFNTELKCGEDLLFNYEVFKKSNKFVQVEECLYNYRRDNLDAVTNVFNEACILSYKATKAFVEDADISDEIHLLCVRRHVRGLFRIINDIIVSKNSKLREKYYKEILNELLKYKSNIINDRLYLPLHKLSILLLKYAPCFYNLIIRISKGKRGKLNE